MFTRLKKKGIRKSLEPLLQFLQEKNFMGKEIPTPMICNQFCGHCQKIDALLISVLGLGHMLWTFLTVFAILVTELIFTEAE